GKRKVVYAGVVFFVLVVIAAAAYALLGGNREAGEPAVTDTSVNGEAPSEASPTEQPNQSGEENKMANYDLTVDSEGLSKAVATMTLESGGVVKWRFYTNDAPNTVKRIAQ